MRKKIEKVHVVLKDNEFGELELIKVFSDYDLAKVFVKEEKGEETYWDYHIASLPMEYGINE
mgnify:CR=1 FL=1